MTAKILATIDVLSEGRLTWGIGVGWCKEEFEAIGTEPFEERGAVTDETIAVCRELWSNENPSFNGKYAKFSNVFFQPRPVQTRVPIWVGGESGPAMRRTAKLGDAWYPIGTNPANRLDTLGRLEAGLERLRQLTREAGRDPAAVGLAYRFSQFGKAIPERADNGERRLGSGDDRGDRGRSAGVARSRRPRGRFQLRRRHGRRGHRRDAALPRGCAGQGLIFFTTEARGTRRRSQQ